MVMIHRTRHAHHFEHALIGGFVHASRQRCRAGDVDIQPIGRRRIVDDLRTASTDWFPWVLPWLAGQIELDVSGFAVPALHAGGREWVSPHVLDCCTCWGSACSFFTKPS